MGKEKFGVAVDEEVVQEVDELVAESADLGASRSEIVDEPIPTLSLLTSLNPATNSTHKQVFTATDERNYVSVPLDLKANRLVLN